MGRFTKVSKEDASGAGKWFLEGHHEVEIVTCKAFDGQDGLTFVIEATVLKSTNSQMVIGTDYSQTLKLEKHKPAAGNLAAFMTVLVPLMSEGEEYPTDPTEREALLELIAPENGNSPAKGVRMSVEAWITKTKAKTDFTKLKWGPPKHEVAAA